MGPMNTEPTMMTIGSFAEITLLSQKALRLYDESGLLTPARVDPANGYRFYAQEQAATGRLIALLRAAGMPLHTVARVIQCSSPGEARALIDAFGEALHTATTASATVLARARRQLTEEPMHDITTAPATEDAVLSELVYPEAGRLDETIRAALGRLGAIATARAMSVTGDPFGVFHGPVNDDSNLRAQRRCDGHGRRYRLPGDPRGLRHRVRMGRAHREPHGRAAPRDLACAAVGGGRDRDHRVVAVRGGRRRLTPAGCRGSPAASAGAPSVH
jgi:DNA-binding transcriptional MerR regulator